MKELSRSVDIITLNFLTAWYVDSSRRKNGRNISSGLRLSNVVPGEFAASIVTATHE